MSKLLQNSLLVLVISSLTTLSAYHFIDKPLAFWVTAHAFNGMPFFEWLDSSLLGRTF